jgi:hypothetical protein
LKYLRTIFCYFLLYLRSKYPVVYEYAKNLKIFCPKGSKLAAKVRQVMLTIRVILNAQNRYAGVFFRSFQATYLKKTTPQPPLKSAGELKGIDPCHKMVLKKAEIVHPPKYLKF